ncbi:DUF1501 domain-containing protein [Planctomicrobium sp. SH664]|uniref:DUF1501 domain-containing protein n=1 Tax=Planctomicrobium sp. SH664 TaxID=3448125 RepID=UPI003F5B18CD
MLTPQGLQLLNRRTFLSQLGAGMAGIPLLQLLAKEGLLASESGELYRPVIDPARPYAPRVPHLPAKADQLLIIYCAGAVSQVDSFDYKPDLYKYHGQDAPNAPKVTFGGPAGKLARPFWDFKPRGECGKMTSELFPQLGELADDICFIHSLTAKSSAHTQGENFLSTGFVAEGYPSLGAWTTYALGSPNQNLPAFVSISDPRGRTEAGPNNWGSGFLPATFQGTSLSADQPPRNLLAPHSTSAAQDRAARSLLQQLNESHLERYPGDSQLAARIASYELAGRMQLSIPELLDLSQEPQHVLKAYGADDSDATKAAYARNCILARRLLEQQVRVVQLFNGGSQGGGGTNWDSHFEIERWHGHHARIFDQPTAAMLKDLKERGLLERTLVVWCTEFGRNPFMQGSGTGRDHGIDGFTCFLMGAGVKAPFSFGATDELGWKAVEQPRTLYDFNATILRILGFDHERLTYYHNGTERRLTDVHGHVIEELLA